MIIYPYPGYGYANPYGYGYGYMNPYRYGYYYRPYYYGRGFYGVW